jgi:hypothetical protein
MNMTRHVSALVALMIFSLACGGARTVGEFVPGPAADFRGASAAEVRNAQEQVILSGQFVETAGETDEVERKATLAATGVDADASGAVEVESCRDADCKSQEIEFEVLNVEPATVLRLLIDGKDFGTVTTDSRGRASVERNVPLPR